VVGDIIDHSFESRVFHLILDLHIAAALLAGLGLHGTGLSSIDRNEMPSVEPHSRQLTRGHQQRPDKHKLRPDTNFWSALYLPISGRYRSFAVSTWRMRASHTKSVNSGRFCQKKRMKRPRNATASSRPASERSVHLCG